MATAREIQESLEASRHEGIVGQVPITILDYFMVPFALFLGASSREIGLLTALPSLLCAFSQFFVVDVLRAFGNRRKLLIWTAGLQALSLAPLCALPFVRGTTTRIDALLACVSGFRVVAALMGPPWGSLMSDYLQDGHGNYFGRRSQAAGISGMVTAAICGGMLYALGAKHAGAWPYFGLFLAACLFRFVSLAYMRKMVDLPEHPHAPAEEFDWSAAWRRARESNFFRFMCYVAAVTFAAQMTAAYLTVHMMRDLRFSYLAYTTVQLSAAVASFLSFPVWGRHSDHVGNARVLRLNSVLLPLIPVLLCMTEAPWGLALIEAMDGFVWAGFNLCATNFIYEAVPAPKRVRALGYFNLINGISLFGGAALGGSLADVLPPTWGYSIHTLFLLSAALRFCADFLLAYHFREVRADVRRCWAEELFFSVIGIRPMVGPNLELEFDAPASMAVHHEERLE